MFSSFLLPRLLLAGVLLLAALPLHAQPSFAYKRYTVSGIQPLQGGTLSGAELGTSPGPEILISGLNANGTILTQLYSGGTESLIVERGDTLYTIGFQLVTQTLEQVWRSSSLWRDFDADGSPDLLLMGARNAAPPYSPVSAVYLNNRGSLTLMQSATATLPGLYDGAIAAGDVYGTGEAYVAMTGLSASDELTFVLARLEPIRVNNQPSLRATITYTGNFGLSLAALALGDCDADGDLDVALTGLDAAGLPTARIYRNTGSDFTEMPQSLTGVFNGSLAFGDIDGDGDDDLVLTGATYGPALVEGVTTVYRSQDCVLTPEPTFSASGLAGNTALLRDHDNDGDLDLLLNGLTGQPTAPDATLMVYLNNGAGGFTLYDSRAGALYSNAFWLDLNNDGFIDPIVAGSAFGAPAVIFYRKPGRPAAPE